jgi:hypothetical protein
MMRGFERCRNSIADFAVRRPQPRWGEYFLASPWNIAKILATSPFVSSMSCRPKLPAQRYWAHRTYRGINDVFIVALRS